MVDGAEMRNMFSFDIPEELIQELTLPVHVLKPCWFPCPWCGGSMRSDIVETGPCVNPGYWIVHNIPVYRCSECGWDMVPFESSEFSNKHIEEAMKKEIEE